MQFYSKSFVSFISYHTTQNFIVLLSWIYWAEAVTKIRFVLMPSTLPVMCMETPNCILCENFYFILLYFIFTF